MPGEANELTQPPPPDDLPKSPTGRIPQWVVDEASGRTVDAPGFRSHGVPDPLSTATGSRRGRRWLTTVVVLVVLVGLAIGARQLGISATSGPSVVAAPLGTFDSAGVHPVNGPPPGVEEESAPLGAPEPLPGTASDAYRFQLTQDDDVTPVTWSPCRPIHYVVRTANQPRGGAEGIRRAIAAVSVATGLKFVDDGTTVEAPDMQRDAYQPDRYGDRWAPVLVAWATPDEVPDFGVDIAGEAGSVRVSTPSGDQAFVSGAVLLDPASYRQIARQVNRAAADAVILHEFGHLVGLAHVNDERQVMYPRSGPESPTTFQRGDLTGLAALGRGACQPNL